MKTVPLPLKLLAILFALIALSFPLQVLYLYGVEGASIASTFGNISILNFAVMITLLVQIPLLLRGSRALAATIPFTVLLVGWNNYVVFSVGHDFSTNSLQLATGGFALLSGLLFHPRALMILKYPHQRWWLQAPRVNVPLDLQVSFLRGRSKQLRTFDVSKTGAFIPLANGFLEDQDLKPGDMLTLKFCIGSIRQMKCDAQIVRAQEASGRYPKGIGIKFVDLSRQDQRLLQRYLSISAEHRV